MARRVPPKDVAHDGREALRIGTVAAVRAWAQQWDVPLLTSDDELLLVSIHEARANEPTMPAKITIASKRWLKTHGERIMQARRKSEANT